jgi:hypothetical protein
MRELDRLKCIQGLIDGQLKQHARERRAARPCSKPRARRQYFGELIQIDGSSDPDALLEETGASSNVRFADADV